MNQKIFHGNFNSEDLADQIENFLDLDHFDIYRTRSKDALNIQIRTAKHIRSGGKTAIGILLRDFEDGVIVNIGEQNLAGIATSIGISALSTILNPANLLHRIDDIAQDIESIQLEDHLLDIVIAAAESLGTGFALSDQFHRIKCSYCATANKPGKSNCIACGAPLGDEQLCSCKHCGFVYTGELPFCPNCKKKIS